MWIDYVREGGPLMFAVLGAWLVVLAGALERLLYVLSRWARRPVARAARYVRCGEFARAEGVAQREAQAARSGLARMDAVSQLATSLGLFGTVLGIARGFLARGDAVDAAARLEGLVSGLSTALYTTIAGLAVFLFGQATLIVYREWLTASERRMARALEVRA